MKRATNDRARSGTDTKRATCGDRTESQRKPEATPLSSVLESPVAASAPEATPDVPANVMNAPSPSTEPKVRRMESTLMSRLRTREYAARLVWQLDFRTAQFASLVAKHGDRMLLRDPGNDEWPLKGDVTTDRAVAEQWIRMRYAAWIVDQLSISRVAPEKALITVAEAVQELLDELHKASAAAGQPEDTFLRKDASLVSMLTAHVNRVLGPRLLTSLDGDTVHRVVNELKAKVKIFGQRERQERPADAGTKRRFLSTLRRVWKQVFPTSPPPFAYAHVVDSKPPRRASTEVRGFDDHDAFAQEANGALEPSEILYLLAAAMYYDERTLRRPNLRNSFIPNTAHMIAISIGYGTRVSEGTMIRWGHRFSKPKPHLRVHSAKPALTNVPVRAVPQQQSVEPWFDDLEACSDIASLVAVRGHYNVVVLRTDPHAPLDKPGVASTFSTRVSAALKLASLKIEKKALHGLRATFISMAAASPLIDGKTLQMYAGHDTVPKGHSTERYLAQLLELMEPAHQHLIQVPTPDEVRAELERCRAEFDLAWVEKLRRKA